MASKVFKNTTINVTLIRPTDTYGKYSQIHLKIQPVITEIFEIRYLAKLYGKK